MKDRFRLYNRQLVCTCLCLLVWLAWATPLAAQPYDTSPTPHGAISFGNVSVDQHNLHYAITGNEQELGLLFVHGTPGGWQAFEAYLASAALREGFLMVSVDRLGWGESAMPSQSIDGDFELQARSLVRIMKLYPDKKWIIIGHSLGASIAPKAALLAPRQVAGLLLLSGSLDPKLGRPRWFNRAANTWLIQKLIPESLARSNDEIMALAEQLRIMSQQIQDTHLDTNLVVIQGGKDKLVSPKNTAYVEQHWLDHFAVTELIKLPEAGHFLPWEESATVIQTIHSMADALTQSDETP